MILEEQTYQLRILPGGSIRIEREGHGQTIPNEALCRNGWNSLADCARLIEGKILEKWK